MMTDDELKELIASLAIGQKQLQHTQLKTDEKLQQVEDHLTETATQQIEVAKDFFFQSLLKNCHLGSVQFDDITKGMIKQRGNIREEYHLFMTNETAIAIIEIKYHLHSKDLEKLERKLDNFKKLYPIYQNHQLYGALACFHLADELKNEAIERGYFVLQRSSDIIHCESRHNQKVKFSPDSSKPQSQFVSLQDYLKNESLGKTRHEYINGYIYDLECESENHHKISRNILFELKTALQEKNSLCQAYNDKLLKQGGKYFYPDAMVLTEADEQNAYPKTAPVILVEVLSPTTRKKDLTSKRFFYQNIFSLEEYLLIEQDKAEIQVRRKKEHWQSRYYYLGDKITLESIDACLNVEKIYHQIDNPDVAEYLQSGR
jgi:Uma2 family endonuclease